MTADALSALLERDRAVVLAALGAVIALAWGYLLLGAGVDMEMMDMGGGQMMAMAPEWSVGYGAVLFIMWAVMMVAMMLPSAAPVVLLAATVDRHRRTRLGRSALFAVGYLFLWFGFSLLATALQWMLDALGLLSETMAIGSRLLTGGVLVIAGIYQWTPLKQACLTRCRSPLELMVRYWGQGRRGAVLAGLRHGLFCLGCCWMLMALLFVVGLMNLVGIGAIALLVLLEKTLPWGGRMSQVAGVMLVVWGSAVLSLAL